MIGQSEPLSFNAINSGENNQMKCMNRELIAIFMCLCAFQAQAIEDQVQDAKVAESSQSDPNRIVGRVDGQTIRMFDVTEEMRKIPPQYQKQIPKSQLYSSTLQRLALQMAVSKKARDLKIDQTVDYKKAKQEIELNLLREMYLFGDVKEALSEEGLKKEYEAYLKDFKEEQEVRARHILVKEESEAKEIIAQIKGGEDFAKIAEKKSLDYATAKRGGDLDYFNRSNLIPEFTKVAFDSLKDGEVTETPVKSTFGYHIIKREGARASKPLPFEKAKASVLPNGVRQRAIQSKMKEAIDATKIELFNVDGSPLSLAVPGINAPITTAVPSSESQKTEAKPVGQSASHAEVAAPVVEISAAELGEEAGKSVK